MAIGLIDSVSVLEWRHGSIQQGLQATGLMLRELTVRATYLCKPTLNKKRPPNLGWSLWVHLARGPA